MRSARFSILTLAFSLTLTSAGSFALAEELPTQEPTQAPTRPATVEPSQVPTEVPVQDPIQVIVVGTYHFANPGLDLHNVEAADVLTPNRQAELLEISESLARFKPNVVAVEWEESYTDEQYTLYRGGAEPARNEVEQLGFRLAAALGLERVHGIDVEGAFPFGAVKEWAEANEQGARLSAMQAGLGEFATDLEAKQKTESIGGILRYINDPRTVARVNGMYGDALRYGRGEEQPGVALNVAWAARNYGICARLVQALEAGDRAIVFYGLGHAHWLWRCLDEVPGIERVDALGYLPE